MTNDGFVEASEQFEVILTLTDAQIVIGTQGRTTVTIIDNDGKECFFKRNLKFGLYLH